MDIFGEFESYLDKLQEHYAEVWAANQPEYSPAELKELQVMRALLHLFKPNDDDFSVDAVWYFTFAVAVSKLGYKPDQPRLSTEMRSILLDTMKGMA